MTCFLWITLGTSSQPTHHSTRCHWSQSSYSCQCMRSWDSHTPPLDQNTKQKRWDLIHTSMVLNCPCLKNNIKASQCLVGPQAECNPSAARSWYRLFLYQASDHVTSERQVIITRVRICSYSRWMMGTPHRYAVIWKRSAGLTTWNRRRFQFQDDKEDFWPLRMCNKKYIFQVISCVSVVLIGIFQIHVKKLFLEYL